MAEGSRLRTFCTLLRNLVLAACLYAFIFGAIELLSHPGSRVRGRLGIPAWLDKSGPTDILKTTKSGVKVKFAASSTPVTINPHANVFNRPDSAVLVKDDYLGPRPHVDTEADLQLLVDECRGTYNGLEKMRNVFDCLQFFADDEDRYYSLPSDKSRRASAQDPRRAEYTNADRHSNTLDHYVSVSDAQPYSANSSGTCSGPVVPYHVYWAGPATWRVEIFIKAYLHSQNLACSHLNLWLDADRDPDAVEHMLRKDPLFARFLPFVERGDITVREWTFPQRIPLPEGLTTFDGIDYYKSPGKPNSKGESAVADGIVRDEHGQQWLALTPKQMTFLPQAISDAVRFVILHVHGGLYLDMDVLLLRDMRPLLLPSNHSFAERWAAHSHPGDYNTAILSLSANTSLSSYLLRGGVRMGVNFHPRVIGRMAWKDGRDQELLMLETAAFDPIWTEFNWDREGRCTVPCLRDYGAAFKGRAGALRDEWESYDGPQLPEIEWGGQSSSGDAAAEDHDTSHGHARRSMRWGKRAAEADHNATTATTDAYDFTTQSSPDTSSPSSGTSGSSNPANPHDGSDSFASSPSEEAELRKAGVIAEYVFDEDRYQPNNRTLQNFFRGAWTYHVHNQWSKHPEPSSWIDVLQHAHDGFFSGQRTNMYGEKWDGPKLMPYNFWPEYV